MANDKNRRAGRIWVRVNGKMLEAKGNYTINPGQDKREAVLGADGVHGYKETPQVAYIEGAMTDHPDLGVADFVNITGSTVTLQLNNGKTWVLEDAWYAGEGNITTEEGEIAVRFESRNPATEMRG